MQNWLKYYHPQNYELRPLELKRKSGWKKKKKKIGPKIEPWGTPDMTVSNSLYSIHYLFEHIVYVFFKIIDVAKRITI